MHLIIHMAIFVLRTGELFTACSHPNMEKRSRKANKPWGRHQGIRISEDQWKVLNEMVTRSGGKLNKSAFIRRAIDEKLERDVPADKLKEFGYIKSY